MKRIIQGLLVALAVVSSAHATTYSSKPFLMARNSLSNNAVASMMGAKSSKNKSGFGANVSAVGYYRRSHNDTDMAKYFGGGRAKDKNQTGIIDILGTDYNAYVGQDIEASTAGAGKSFSGKLNLKPVREEYGAQLNWNQCLGKFVDGLWFSVSAPIVDVSTNMGLSVTDYTKGTVYTNTIESFFNGSTLTKAAAHTQAALTAAKIDNKDHTTGVQVADVSVRVGYDFLKDADYKVGANLHVMIPTGNSSTGAWTFEPMAGQGGAFQIGAALNAGFNLWRSADKKSSLDLNLNADYRYALEDTQKRVVGVWSHGSDALTTQGRHSLVVTNLAANLTPAANLLNMDVTVEGGSQFDGSAGFNFRWNQVSFDLCYNLFVNDTETVKLASTSKWTDDKYGFAIGAATFAAAANNKVGDIGFTYGGPIQNENKTTTALAISTSNALRYYIKPAISATPSQLTHKVATGVNYSFDMKTPINVGIVAEYEIAGSDNSSVNSWMLGGKVGICF